MDGFWNLPAVLQSAVFGAAGGLVGGLIAILLRRTPAFANSPNVSPVVTALCVGLALVFGNGLAAPYRHKAHIDSAMVVLEKNKAFAALFKYHPESRAAMRTRLMDIREDISRDEIARQATAAGREAVAPYLAADLLNAPDDAVHGLLESNLALDMELQSHPEACVDLFLGKDPADRSLVTPADVQRESDAIAAVIEGAALHPSPPPEHPDIRVVARQIALGFQAKGYDVQDLRLLGHLGQVPAPLGCRVVTEFTDVLAAMPPAQGATVLKSLNVAARSAKPRGG